MENLSKILWVNFYLFLIYFFTFLIYIFITFNIFITSVIQKFWLLDIEFQ